jgi:GT2 family glycosyltransferase
VTAVRTSICIPAYQAEAHLAETLDSVLASDADGLEIVVLDNASTDRTAKILNGYKDPRIRRFRNDQVLPIAENWNRAVQLSTGELIKVVCADDVIRPDSVRRQAEILATDPGIALVGSRRHLIDDSGSIVVADRGLFRLLGRHDGASVAAQVVRSGGNPLGESAGLTFRRKDFDAVGGFDGRLVFPMDLDLWVRLLRYGDFVGVPETMAAFRASTTSLSSERSRKQYLEARELTRQIAADPEWHVGAIDKMIGRVGAPLARLRREIVFRMSGRSQQAVLARLTSARHVDWIPTRSPRDGHRTGQS